ncbi:HEPN domain-containing protein [Geoglobus ahangari]
MEFLKNNALKFLKKAEESLRDGDYNFTMFFAEQSLQLMLKYLIAKKFGEFPKTHNLKTLFYLTDDEMLIKFYEDNMDILRELELSYVASRYFDVDYSEDVAKKGVETVRKFMEVSGIE